MTELLKEAISGDILALPGLTAISASGETSKKDCGSTMTMAADKTGQIVVA